MITSGLLPIVNTSLEIAYGYLERSGQLENRDLASQLIIESIKTQLRAGERRPLMLANRAIENYQRACTGRRAVGAPPLAPREVSFPWN